MDRISRRYFNQPSSGHTKRSGMWWRWRDTRTQKEQAGQYIELDELGEYSRAKTEKRYLFHAKADEITRDVDWYAQGAISIEDLASQTDFLKRKIVDTDRKSLGFLRQEKEAKGFKVTEEYEGLSITSRDGRDSKFQISFEEAVYRYQDKLNGLSRANDLSDSALNQQEDIEEHVIRHVALVEHLAEEKYRTVAMPHNNNNLASRPNPDEWKSGLQEMLKRNAQNLEAALNSENY